MRVWRDSHECGNAAGHRPYRRILAVVSSASVVSLAHDIPTGAWRSRHWSERLGFRRVTVVPTPPVSEEDALYKIVVQDKNTDQPIETGAGRLFASSIDQAQTYDGLAKGKEVGTYYAHLRFPRISGRVGNRTAISP